MLAFSPQLFATTITGALRLGREGYIAHLHGLMDDQDIRAFIPLTSGYDFDDPVSKSASEITSWVIQQVMFSEEFLPGRAYEGIFLTQENAPGTPVIGAGNLPALNPERPDLFEAALLEKTLDHQLRVNRETSAKTIRQSLITYQTKAWADENDPSPWGVFFRNMLDVGFDILAVQPGLLGIGGNVEAFIRAILPNIAESYKADDPHQSNVMREIAETFSEAALKALADNPTLVTDEAKWQPLIAGILKPVHDDVTKHGINQLFAERRLRELMSGPVAFGAISALTEHADDFLKGDFASDSIPGQIVRDTLGIVASGSAEGFQVRKFFSDEAAMTVMASALRVAKKNPQLFVREGRFTEEGTEHGRHLLTMFADTFLNSPKPFSMDKDLAVTLACKSLDIVSEYSVARLAANAGEDAHKQARADMAAHVISDILNGFQRRLNGEKENLLTTVFSRPQMIDVMQIMAKHVARSPHHFISDNTNPQVVAMAEAVAQAISEDTSGLLHGDDWKEIITVAMDVARKNPGRLFSLKSDDPADSVALLLISRMLKTAREGMANSSSDRPWLLFGETLSEAIRITLTASASGALSLIRDPEQLQGHLNEVAELATRLNTLAQNDDPTKAISAADWLSIFAFYIPHVIETGPGALDALTDDMLLQALADGVITLNTETQS